jgi:hypothetical protein
MDHKMHLLEIILEKNFDVTTVALKKFVCNEIHPTKLFNFFLISHSALINNLDEEKHGDNFLNLRDKILSVEIQVFENAKTVILSILEIYLIEILDEPIDKL